MQKRNAEYHKDTQGHTHTHRHKETHTQSRTETHSNKHRQTESHRHTHRRAESHTDRGTHGAMPRVQTHAPLRGPRDTTARGVAAPRGEAQTSTCTGAELHEQGCCGGSCHDRQHVGRKKEPMGRPPKHLQVQSSHAAQTKSRGGH